MSFFIFLKDSNNIEGTCYKIAENSFDLDNLNISKDAYKILEDSQSNFDLVKYGKKITTKYYDNNIVYNDIDINFTDILATNKKGEQILIISAKTQLKNCIENFKKQIKSFIDNNKNHVLFNKWNNYYNQLNNLDLDSIQYPLNTSLEQYFKDQNLPSLHTLQIP